MCGASIFSVYSFSCSRANLSSMVTNAKGFSAMSGLHICFESCITLLFACSCIGILLENGNVGAILSGGSDAFGLVGLGRGRS